MTSDSLRHAWDVTPAEAIAIQRKLAARVIQHDDLGPVQSVAGVDVGFEEDNTITRAAVVVLDFPSLKLREEAIARLPTSFPYIPGLLSFREGPAIMEALGKLEHWPDLMLFDGQGIAHPRRLGIACHIGLLTNTPSIGVGKSRLRGHAKEALGNEKGEWKFLWDKEEIIGALVRTRAGTKPLYISIGHRVGLETAVKYVLACTTRYKLPETTRLAHRLASG